MRRGFLFALCLLCALAFQPATTATAQQTETSGWEWAASLYLWASSVDGSTFNGGDVSIDFKDIVDRLDVGLLGAVEGRNGRWSILADAIYLSMSDGSAASFPVAPGLPGGGFTLNSVSDVRVKSTVLGFVGGYQIAKTPNLYLDAIGGLRYLDLDTRLALNVTSTVGGLSRSVYLSGSQDVLDGIVGLRGRATIDENWFIPFYVDIGGGSSDFTWQAFGGVGYDFGRSEFSVGYRHAYWDFGSGGLVSDIAFSGPIFAWKYKF